MNCLPVATWFILRILTLDCGITADMVLKSLDKEYISQVPPTMMGKLSLGPPPPPDAAEAAIRVLMDWSHSLVRPRKKRERPGMEGTQSTISALMVATWKEKKLKQPTSTKKKKPC